MDYRTGSHSRSKLKIHLVWIIKYPKRILKGDVSLRLPELIREICKANESDRRCGGDRKGSYFLGSRASVVKVSAHDLGEQTSSVYKVNEFWQAVE